jgi:formamidase
MIGATHRISLDLGTSLVGSPQKGHNRWHPALSPAARVRPGDTVVADTRDGTDGQITASTSRKELARVDVNRIHPLTGPIFIEDAEPDDWLDVEILAIEPAAFGFTLVSPGSGILGDLIVERDVVKWTMHDGVARSADLPGIAIPAAPFIGVIGVAPSEERLHRFADRESALARDGGLVLGPDARGAVPSDELVASEGLRTIPPRETGGNMDNKYLRTGSCVSFRVDVPGALLSLGDVHFAQGDGEACGQGIEMQARVHLRVSVRKGGGVRWTPRCPVIVGTDSDDCRLVTMGIPVDEAGTNHDLDLSLAMRNALLDMVSYLTDERGYSLSQAYALTSATVDLHITEAVNHPNVLVSAVLPLSVLGDV